MIAHNIQDCDIPANIISNSMTFHQAIPDASPMMDSANTMQHIARMVSLQYDDKQMMMPAAAPVSVSPCVSEESVAAIPITGNFSNIEYKYHIDTRVLGTGQHGSVRKCVDRTTGEHYAVKSICKSDPTAKPGGFAREIMLLEEMKHDNIVHLVDVYEDADYVHLVTDLCQGGELFDKICEKSSNSDNGACCLPRMRRQERSTKL